MSQLCTHVEWLLFAIEHELNHNCFTRVFSLSLSILKTPYKEYNPVHTKRPKERESVYFANHHRETHSTPAHLYHVGFTFEKECANNRHELNPDDLLSLTENEFLAEETEEGWTNAWLLFTLR